MPANSAPTELGHYRILSLLGAGGMGEVYLAMDTRLQRNVAIKVLPRSTAANDDAQRRMLREARMVATIDHPNVCTIYEIGGDDARPYIVMQYIEGETLMDRRLRAALTLAETIDIARQITSALAVAHERGIVHRDIKPGNIMISSTGAVKVLDFGLAKSFAQEAGEATDVMISSPGMVIGTTPYMSPEQLRALPLDGRSDLFSLGVVLYEMATGARPFDRPSAAATMSAILTEPPPNIADPQFAPLQPIIKRALAKPLARRFQSAAQMRDALTQSSAAQTPRQRRPAKRKAKRDPEAEKIYLRGRMHWNKRHPDAMRQAIACFQEAVERDPLYANAYAGLADAYVLLGFLQALPPSDIVPKAKASALRAIELDPDLAEPHASLGYVAGMFEWDWPTADRELSEAMRLNPNYPWAPHWYGLLLIPRAPLEESLAYVQRARELDPLSPIINTAAGIPLHLHRRYQDAVHVYSNVLDSEPSFAPVHYYLAMSYEQMGNYSEALRNLERACEIGGRGAVFVGALGHCYGRSGRHDDARVLLRELEDRSKNRYISPYNVMLIHLGLGDIESALVWLERAFEEHSAWLTMTALEPRFDVLRDSETFQSLIAAAGF